MDYAKLKHYQRPRTSQATVLPEEEVLAVIADIVELWRVKGFSFELEPTRECQRRFPILGRAGGQA